MGTFNDRFLRACRREATDLTPVWFMRQAGRYLPEYRALREKHSLLELATTPELAVTVTLQPINRFDFDAAILFADILLPLPHMGCPFSFEKGEGPVIHKPLTTADDIAALKEFEPRENLSCIGKSVSLLSNALQDRVPLIGFAGAPFTLASYMIEGGKSRHFLKTKRLMREHPKAWAQLMEKITKITIEYLAMQIEQGAKAIQLFDSWVGNLSPEDYRRFVFPFSSRILNAIASRHPSIPRIHFGTGTATLLPLLKDAGATVVGVDWQTPLSYAANLIGNEVALQGNLDPTVLFASTDEIDRAVDDIFTDRPRESGHVFNLGHGILPETPIASVERVLEKIRSRKQR